MQYPHRLKLILHSAFIVHVTEHKQELTDGFKGQLNRFVFESEAVYKMDELHRNDMHREVNEIIGNLECKRKRVRWREVASALATYLNGFAIGIVSGFTSPTMASMKAEGVLANEDEVSWFGSSLTLGVAVGGPVAILIIDRFGRKTTVLATYVPFAFGWFVISLASEVYLLCLGRVLLGLAGGMGMMSGGIYLAEIASNEYRGVFVSGYAVFINLAILFSFSAGFFIPWRYFAMFGSIFSAFSCVIGAVIMEESPRWWMSHGFPQLAQKALQRLRGSGYDIMPEFGAMQLSQDNKPVSLSLAILSSPGVYKPALIALLAMVAQQACGINPILFFATAVFNNAGWKGSDILPSSLVGLASVLGVFLSIFLVDRAGRRPLMIATSAVLSISCVAMGVASYLQEVNGVSTIGWLALLGVMAFLFTFALGPGPVAPTIAAEILPPSVRGLFSGIIIFIMWMVSFGITEGVPELSLRFGQYVSFWMLAGINIILTILMIIFLPETKGKSLEEIEDMFRESSSYGQIN